MLLHLRCYTLFEPLTSLSCVCQYHVSNALAVLCVNPVNSSMLLAELLGWCHCEDLERDFNKMCP